MAKELRVIIAGDSTALQAALARASGATSGFAASVTSVGKRIKSTGETLTKGVTLPIVAIGALSGKAAVDFQNAMELLHTQAGIAQASIAGLSKQVLALAGPTATAPDELAAGLYHLESQGLRGAKAIDTLRIAAEGAKMGQADLEDVTNALGAVIASKISGVKSYGQAMGELNATVGAGDMRMQDLADAMGTGLPAKAAVAGVSLRDVGAALAVFGDNNIRGAAAGTLLNSTMRLMEGPSHAAAKAMAKYGISAKELGDTLSKHGLVSAIELLHSKLGDLDHAALARALTPMFGGKQSGGVQILIDQLARLKTKVKEVDDGGASFAKNWNAYTKTAAYHLDSMGAAMAASGVSIGNILLPVVSELTNKISGAVQWFDGLSDHTKKFILIAAGIAAAIGPAVSIIGSIVTVVGGVIGAVAAVGTAFAAAGSALAPFIAAITGITVPAGAVAAAVAGIVAVVAALVVGVAAAVIWPKQFATVLEKMGLSAQQATTVIRVLQTVFQDVKVVVSAVVNAVEALWARFGDLILAQARTTWNTIRGVIDGALTIIRGLVNIFGGLLHGDWSRVWLGIQQVFSGAWQIIKSLVSGALQTIEHLMTAWGRAAMDILSAAWGVIKRDAASAWDDLASAVSKKVAELTGKVKAGLDKMLAWVRALPGEMEALGEAAGKAILTGIADGIKSALGPALSAAEKAKDALKSVWHAAFGSTPDEWGNYAVGTPLMKGIAAGILSSTTLAKTAAERAKQIVKAELEAKEIYGQIQEYGRVIGMKQAEGVVMGIVQGTPSVVQQTKTALQQAVQQARQTVVENTASFKSAFGQLASEGLSAFDQKVQAWVSPASKLLAKMQLQDQINSAKDAIASANDQLSQSQDAVTKAQQALDDYLATAGGTPAQLAAVADATTKVKLAQDALNAAVSKYGETSDQALQKQLALHSAQSALSKAQAGVGTDPDQVAQLQADLANAKAQVVANERALGAAKRQQQELNLQLEDVQQQKNYQKRMATEREQMAKELVQLQKALLKNPDAWKKMGGQVEAVLKKFGVRMVPSGQAWASQFASGIRQGIPAAEAAAKALAKAVDDYMPHSPARKGPLAYDAAISGRAWSEMFARGFNSSFLDVNGTAGDRLTALARGAGGGVGRAASGTLVHVENMEVRDEVDIRLVARELAAKLGAV